MKRRAGIHWMVLVGIVGAVAILFLLFSGGESASAVGVKFMEALARGDADELTQLSYHPDKSSEELKQEWEYTTQTVGKHYLFTYAVLGEQRQDEDQATVRLQVTRNLGSGSYEENFGLPMEKRDGKWRVVVNELSREMYPGLPR